jgi:hypothetical protein
VMVGLPLPVTLSSCTVECRCGRTAWALSVRG